MSNRCLCCRFSRFSKERRETDAPELFSSAYIHCTLISRTYNSTSTLGTLLYLTSSRLTFDLVPFDSSAQCTCRNLVPPPHVTEHGPQSSATHLQYTMFHRSTKALGRGAARISSGTPSTWKVPKPLSAVLFHAARSHICKYYIYYKYCTNI